MGGLLPVEFHAKLNTSCRIGGRDRAEIGVSEIRIWLEEVRVIQCIKHLEAELQAPLLTEAPPLLYAHIPIEVSGRPEIREESGRIAEGEGPRL